MKEFLGQTGFVWWHGVVEDVSDPLYLGRVRVRVFGYHSDNIGDLPVNSLPWAYPMQPITSAALSGIGTSPTGLLTGSHVFGFFRDGSEAQDPVVMGSFGGIPQHKQTTSGFSDPSGRYPVSEMNVIGGTVPRGVSVIGESDTNRMARNDGAMSAKDDIPKFKSDSILRNIVSVPDTAEAKIWNEPVTPYDAVYPKNHVRFTESGHMEEFDDTPGAERIHQYHTSGSFTEIGNGWISSPDGSRVQRIVGDDYEICYGNKKICIKGKEGVDLVVDGGINITTTTVGNIQIGKDANVLIKGKANISIDGNIKISGKQIEFDAEENVAFSGKNITLKTDSCVMDIGSIIEITSKTKQAEVSPAKVKI